MEKKSDLFFFNQLFKEYHQRFVRFAYYYVQDIAIAEDYATDALIYYWENREHLSHHSSIPAYILTIIKHKCLNHLEHLQVRQKVSESLMDDANWELFMRIASLKACDPEEVFSSEIQCIVQETLQQLPAKTQEIFSLSRYQNLSYKEISEKTGISIKAIEFHISKAIKALRISLKDYLNSLFFI